MWYMCKYVLDSVQKYVFWGAKFDSFGAKKMPVWVQKPTLFCCGGMQRGGRTGLVLTQPSLTSDIFTKTQRNFHPKWAQNLVKISPVFAHISALAAKKWVQKLVKISPVFAPEGARNLGCSRGNEGPTRTPMGHPPSKRGA